MKAINTALMKNKAKEKFKKLKGGRYEDQHGCEGRGAFHLLRKCKTGGILSPNDEG
jgi:hypothetical protein